MREIKIIALVLLLSGCAGALDRARVLTDAGIAIGAKATDAYMAGLDRIREELETELERVNAAYCFASIQGARRYAVETIENRQRIAKNCGLIVELDTLVKQSVGVIE